MAQSNGRRRRPRGSADTLPDGAMLPPIAELAASHHVSVGTAHRAIGLLETWGLVHVSSGHRTIVTALAS